jgi:repressor LexA
LVVCSAANCSAEKAINKKRLNNESRISFPHCGLTVQKHILVCIHVTITQMSKISERDKQILSYITEQIQVNQVSPTLEEIRGFFNFKSATTVRRSIKKFENQGLLIRNKNKSRGISLSGSSEEASTVNLPILAGVSCGAPNLAEVDVEGYIPTDKTFLKPSADYYYLRAVGDSMNMAGINNGDFALIKRQSTADDGERVVALIDDRATIKELKTGEDYVVLLPKSTNPDHRPIVMTDDFRIQGVVERVFSF